MVRKLSILVVAGLILFTGCSGLTTGPGAGEPTTAAPTTQTSESTTTQERTTTRTARFETGDNLLSVQPINETHVNGSDESERATFEELNESQQSVFMDSYECDCTIEQDQFRFNDKDRIKFVKYEGSWYYLNVAIT